MLRRSSTAYSLTYLSANFGPRSSSAASGDSFSHFFKSLCVSHTASRLFQGTESRYFGSAFGIFSSFSLCDHTRSLCILFGIVRGSAFTISSIRSLSLSFWYTMFAASTVAFLAAMVSKFMATSSNSLCWLAASLEAACKLSPVGSDFGKMTGTSNFSNSMKTTPGQNGSRVMLSGIAPIGFAGPSGHMFRPTSPVFITPLYPKMCMDTQPTGMMVFFPFLGVD
mmetsp:Transcript_11349/g.31592  ORF Transcript_11349/g.31592 Transcript_11349/m.31592 type:complete len:224 (-) Transcript_11349:287-958(-)